MNENEMMKNGYLTSEKNAEIIERILQEKISKRKVETLSIKRT